MDDQQKKSKNRDVNGDTHNYSEEELDRLYARWLVGRQRGKDIPVSNKVLRGLVGSGRVSHDKLNKNELLVLGLVKNQNVSKEDVFVRVCEFIDLVIGGMKIQAEKKVRETIKEAQINQVDNPTLKALTNERFVLDYGASPLEFRNMLISKYTQKATNHG